MDRFRCTFPNGINIDICHPAQLVRFIEWFRTEGLSSHIYRLQVGESTELMPDGGDSADDQTPLLTVTRLSGEPKEDCWICPVDKRSTRIHDAMTARIWYGN